MKLFLPQSRSTTTALAILLAAGAGLALYLTNSNGRARGAQPADGPAARKAPAVDPPQAAPAKASELPLGLRPYRVQVTVAFDNSPALMPAFRDEVVGDLRAAIERGYGRMWDADVEVNGWLAPASLVGLKRLRSIDLVERFPESKRAKVPGFDKVFVLAVQAAGPQIHVAGREFDSRSQQIGPVESVATCRRRAVADAAFSLLPRLFQPSLTVRTLERSGTGAELLLQAGELLPGDPALRQVVPNDAIAAYFRYLDKDGNVRRVQPVLWTYVLADRVQRRYVAGTIVSAYFRAPLGTGRRRRVDLFATRVRPNRPSSRLRMVYQTDRDRPLIGYNVELVRKRTYRDEPAAPSTRQFSGRDGFVDVRVDPEHPVVWVYVFSGEALLARVPYVPGVAGEQTLALPDDSIRLGAERDLELLKGRLVDVVARRATLMALARMASDDEKLTDPQKRTQIERKFAAIDALDGVEQFEQDLGIIRVRATQAAHRLGNRFAERRINQMCDKVGALISKHLDMEQVHKLHAELTAGLKN